MDLAELKRKVARIGLEAELQEGEQFLEVRNQHGKRVYISASEAEHEIANRLEKWLGQR